MNKEELESKILATLGFSTDQEIKDVAAVSIEYAISVLEEIQQILINKFMTKSAKDIEFKIQELKALIK